MTDRSRSRNLRAELDADDGELPTSWIPKPGDVLVGELVRYDRGTTAYGPAVIAVVRDDETGELRGVWLIHHVLREEFRGQRPRPGERVGIKRLPDSERGNYKRYRLVVDRGDGPELPDFEALGPAADAPPPGGSTAPAPETKPSTEGSAEDLPF